MRKTGKSSFDEKCHKIIIQEEETKSDSDLINKNETQNQNKEQTKISKNKTLEIKSEEPIHNEKISNTLKSKEKSAEKIMLNSKSNKELENFYTTKYEKQKIIILYAFTVFCIIIIILLDRKSVV